MKGKGEKSLLVEEVEVSKTSYLNSFVKESSIINTYWLIFNSPQLFNCMLLDFYSQYIDMWKYSTYGIYKFLSRLNIYCKIALNPICKFIAQK